LPDTLKLGMRTILPVLAALGAAGCGYEGQPLPPLANVPGRVTALSATQRGSELVVQFTPPQLTTEGFPIKPPPTLDVRAGPAPDPFNEQTWAEGASKLSAVPRPEGGSSYEMPVNQWAGKQLTVGVRAIGSKGKESPWTFETVPVIPPPQPPSDLRAENTATGVHLSWNSPAGDFRIYRKTGNADFMPAGDVSETSWTDKSSEFGQEYFYKVQAIVKEGDDRQAESELSPEVGIKPVDIFPPATPFAVQATAAPTSIEITWNSNTEPDLAHYRVYRSVSGGPFERVAEVDLPAWSDRGVQAGKQYRYQVTAVDRSGNESPRSQAVEVPFQ
jgi:predicted phage tail protein